MLVPKDMFRVTYQAIKDAAGTVHNGCSVLMLVAPDVDAICAARILATFFRQDNIDHKVTPVAGFGDVIKELQRELAGAERVRSSVRRPRCGWGGGGAALRPRDARETVSTRALLPLHPPLPRRDSCGAWSSSTAAAAAARP